MGRAVKLRTDYTAAELRLLAKGSKDSKQSRRLLSLAAVLDGMSREEAARVGGMDRQTLRDWVHRFNAAGPDGLKDVWNGGPEPRLSPAQKAELAEIVETGPDPAVDGVVRWRLIDLIQWLWEEFRLSISKQTLSRELRAMNDRKLSARPRHHAKSEAAVAAFKSMDRPCVARGLLQVGRDGSHQSIRPQCGA